MLGGQVRSPVTRWFWFEIAYFNKNRSAYERWCEMSFELSGKQASMNSRSWLGKSRGQFLISVWHTESGCPIACNEKIKVLNENLIEIWQTVQDAFEDGLLMGCSETQLRQVFHDLIDQLDNPYSELPAKLPDQA